VIATRRQFLFLAGGFLPAGAGFSARAQKSEETSAARLMDDLMWNHGPIGGPFALIDHTGQPRTDKDFRGKLLLIYFGYSYCPDVCPTDLQQIGLAVDRLGADGEAVQPLFITLDPERDTAAHLADYVPLFHPRLIGVTGSAEEIRRAALAYKVLPARQSRLRDRPLLVHLSGRRERDIHRLLPDRYHCRSDDRNHQAASARRAEGIVAFTRVDRGPVRVLVL
jgi:cytochrome oxidase Cu insertion factor (SCO1/SenC/PrrC family)